MSTYQPPNSARGLGLEFEARTVDQGHRRLAKELELQVTLVAKGYAYSSQP